MKTAFPNISQPNKDTIEKYKNYRLTIKKREPTTVRNEIQTLRKLANHLKNTPFKYATENHMQNFFKIITNNTSSDLYATHINTFYQWVLKLKRRTRSPNMEWYDYQTQRQKDKHTDPNNKENNFITPTDYKKIIEHSKTLQDRALWETYYLSGARRSEIIHMTLQDIKDTGEIVEITVHESKTKPRIIPLPDHPEHLLRWIQNHPQKTEPEAPLWLNRLNTPMTGTGAHSKLKHLIKTSGITKPFTLHSFRKTRAYIMFNDDTNNYKDTQIALFFGWSIREISRRRADYDLTNYNDLLNKVKKSIKRPPTYDQLQHETDTLTKKYEQKMHDLEEKYNRLYEIITKWGVNKKIEITDDGKTTNYKLNKKTADFIPVDKQKQKNLNYENEFFIKTIVMQRYLTKLNKNSIDELTPEEKQNLDNTLQTLTF